MKGHALPIGGDNCEIVEKHWQLFKKTSPEQLHRIQPNLAKKTSLGKLRGFKVVQMKGNDLTQREIIASMYIEIWNLWKHWYPVVNSPHSLANNMIKTRHYIVKEFLPYVCFWNNLHVNIFVLHWYLVWNGIKTCIQAKTVLAFE